MKLQFSLIYHFIILGLFKKINLELLLILSERNDEKFLILSTLTCKKVFSKNISSSQSDMSSNKIEKLKGIFKQTICDFT